MASNEPIDTFFMVLNELKLLLEYPNQLKIEVGKLRSDATQPEEIKGFIALYDSFNGDTIRIKQYLNETESFIKERIPSGKKSFSILKYAAVFFMFIGITMFFYLNFRNRTKITEQKVVSKNLFRDPGIPIYMSVETKINWGELMFALENESSQKAIRVWKKIHKTSAENDTVLYYGGIVYRKALQPEKAIYYFKSNLKTQSNFNEQSLYFLAVYEWEKGHKTKAKKILLKLKNATNLDIRQAVRVNLRELN